MKSKKKKRSSGIRKELGSQIMEFFRKDTRMLLNYKQVARQLQITDHLEKKLVMDILSELADEDRLDEVGRGKFRLHPLEAAKVKQQAVYVTGKLELTHLGTGYVVSPDTDEDVKIAASGLNHALNKDLVKVYLYARRKAKRLEGEIVEIVERARDKYVGTVEASGKYAFFIADDKFLGADLFIPTANLNGATNGVKAIARIEDWPENAKNPIGEIIEVLGKPGEHRTEMNAIIAEFNLPTDFPVTVSREADSIPDFITEKEIERRRDFRKTTTFTIDPVDAKDFDDALSIRKLENNNWEIGIHIADVTHYVKENSILDEEAVARGTSVYLVDRVIPMLPEKLSNNICSLRPEEDKLTYSVVVEMDNNAKILNHWIGRTAIRSDRRFHYDEVQEIIEKTEGDFCDEILLLNQFAKTLREQRFKNGALSFDKSETKFILDENGKPISVFFKVQKDAHKLIEEFMLLANRYVAEEIGKVHDKAKTFVYRIHDDPNPDKLAEFSRFAARFGYKIKTEGRMGIVSSMNKMLKDVKGKGEQNMMETLAIRTMAKAKYTTQNIGHYGLAFPFYTHFTSPIRRYPDMMVHRLLDFYMGGGKSVDADEYEETCKHASDMEKRAEEAERASVKYKQVEYMAANMGKDFEGVISGVTKFGMYVEIVENKCEGMVRLQNLTDDFYYFDEENYQIVGQRHKHKYRLGDSIRVSVKRADLIRKQIDFEIV
ncbi:MAG: ribonuclease R [Bacteroidetes bacterium]|nr:ribonuclease R [Bacteroidota bacterium]MBU1720482.1 ribonuclease R [Bacteroidota bacterium]